MKLVDAIATVIHSAQSSLGWKKVDKISSELRLLVDIIKEVKKTSSVASSPFLPPLFSFFFFLSITSKHRLYLPSATEIEIFTAG